MQSLCLKPALKSSVQSNQPVNFFRMMAHWSWPNPMFHKGLRRLRHRSQPKWQRRFTSLQSKHWQETCVRASNIVRILLCASLQGQLHNGSLHLSKAILLMKWCSGVSAQAHIQREGREDNRIPSPDWPGKRILTIQRLIPAPYFSLLTSSSCLKVGTKTLWLTNHGPQHARHCAYTVTHATSLFIKDKDCTCKGEGVRARLEAERPVAAELPKKTSPDA